MPRFSVSRMFRRVLRQRLAATPHPLFLQRTLVSRKRGENSAHEPAPFGTTWHKAPPTCTRTCAFEGPLGSPRRAIQPSSREKTAHDLRVGELQWTPEDGENVTNRTVNAPLKTGQNEEIAMRLYEQLPASERHEPGCRSR